MGWQLSSLVQMLIKAPEKCKPTTACIWNRWVRRSFSSLIKMAAQRTVYTRAQYSAAYNRTEARNWQTRMQDLKITQSSQPGGKATFCLAKGTSASSCFMSYFTWIKNSVSRMEHLSIHSWIAIRVLKNKHAGPLIVMYRDLNISNYVYIA